MESPSGIGTSYRANSSGRNAPPNQETQQTAQAPMAGGIVYNRRNPSSSPKLHEANNISRAAFKEFFTKAVEAKVWSRGNPALGNLKEFAQRFQTPAPSGMRVECSVEKAHLPIDAMDLAAIMMDVKRWTSLFSHIVCHGSGHDPTGILQKLQTTDETIQDIQTVNAEFQIPTPFVQKRRFRFLRCQREIYPNVWAIVDVSNDYFRDTPPDGALEQKWLRRPSGVIISRIDDSPKSEVIWIENVLVHECHSEANTYYNIINSNLAFCAKNWVSTLSWKLKRKESKFRDVDNQPPEEHHTSLLELAESMKMVYLGYVNETPDESRWITASYRGIRLLKSVMVDRVDTLNFHDYIGVASFRVQANPLSVVNFLVEKNLDSQWLSDAEVAVEFAPDDHSNCITIHEAVVFQTEFTKYNGYTLREVSRDEFCSFVISSPISIQHPNDVYSSEIWGKVSLLPSGFAIMPGGSEGLQSSTSLVTIAKHLPLDEIETGQARRCMRVLINDSIVNILHEFEDG